MDKISVILCTKNRIEDVTKCTESILIQTHRPDEIVVVDSSDTTDLKSRLDSFANLKGIAFNYINVKANLTQARNIAIDNSAGDILIFIDDDVILDKDYIKGIMYVFQADSERKVGGVSGDIVDVDRQRYPVRHFISSYFTQIFGTIFFLFKYGEGKFQPSGYSTSVRSNRVTPVECLSGANMSFRREVISEFRFDEKSPHFEDDDIAYRVSRRYQNVYTPQAKLVHNPSPVGGYGRRPSRMKKEVEGYHHHFKKNLPQTPKHKFAFYWSLLGLLIMQIIATMKDRNTEQLKGFIAGVVSIVGKKAT